MSEAGHGGESLRTVLIALGANTLIAVAKSVAALLTGSASMVAEAAHSWADAGNEVFLLQAERRADRPVDSTHPFGYGRAAYVWAMVAGFGLFTAGSVLSVVHGVNAWGQQEEGGNYLVAYLVLAVAFVLEGISFLQARGQARSASVRRGLSIWRYILGTSETTVRSVYLEDLAALLGIGIAAAGLVLHEVTGNAVYDAAGSILVGVLLGIVAVIVIVRNGQFLVGDAGTLRLRREVLALLTKDPQIDRVTFLHTEFVGPSRLLVLAAVDLVGDDQEQVLATRMQQIEDRVSAIDGVERCLLTLSADDDPGVESLEA